MTPLALDTSVAVPLVIQTHRAHKTVTAWLAGRQVAIAGHALAETYSVITRLPGDIRVLPVDAARLLRERFAPPLLLDISTKAALPDILSDHEIAGGAVYDAMVALAALEHGYILATRDARAQGTYAALGAEVVVVA